MALYAYAEMNNAQLVTAAVKFDQEQKEYKKELDAVKAELQSRGLQIIEDRNVKFIKFFSSDGNASVMDSQQIDVLNPDKLKELLSEGIWKAKVKETTETKYKYDPNWNRCSRQSSLVTTHLSTPLRSSWMRCQ